MKRFQIVVCLAVLIYGFLGTRSAEAAPICTTNTWRATLAWVYMGTEIEHVLMPASGTFLDCVTTPFACEHIKSSSPYGCKDFDAPVSHCVDIDVTQCSDGEGHYERPYIESINLHSVGPCEVAQ
jgi:hypothetical protein